MLPALQADTAWLAEKEIASSWLALPARPKWAGRSKRTPAASRVLLELGGNAALIVHSDWPDLDEAAFRTHTRPLAMPASRASACSVSLCIAVSFRPSCGRWWSALPSSFPAIPPRSERKWALWSGQPKPSA